jgi:hypothetical protein
MLMSQNVLDCAKPSQLEQCNVAILWLKDHNIFFSSSLLHLLLPSPQE